MINRTFILRSIYFVLVISGLYIFQGCFLVRKIAGADIDSLQFERAREAKMYEIRLAALGNLNKRLTESKDLEDSDFSVYLSRDLLERIVRQYESSSGWLDASTSFTINEANLALKDGSAVVSLLLSAYNSSYNVSVDLKMDCILSITSKGNDLSAQIEPFNITPQVSAAGILSSAEDLIRDLIKINVANLGNQFPELKIPVSFSNTFKFESSRSEVRDKINLVVSQPQRNIQYQLILKDIFIFRDAVFVSMNIGKVDIK